MLYNRGYRILAKYRADDFMKKIFICCLLFNVYTTANANDQQLEAYISNFDYEARNEMKMDSQGLIKLLMEGKAQLIDIRFHEEYSAWKVAYSKNIPLNELPKRLDEIDKNKIIVTACPHKDRAIIAMTYLRSKGIQAKYLTDGLIGLAENLRGDNAEEFVSTMETLKN
jgi:rhodanese-related sulfurtransferase